MKPSSERHVVVGVTGSIAAYKSAELVRLLVKRGYEVSVVMTRAATQFVSELTFRTLSRRPVGLDMFPRVAEWVPDHIAFAERAAVLAIAPCTANMIAKMAHGMADDLLSGTALACTAPVVVAPAMNVMMWRNPALQANLRTLAERGARIVDCEEGDLACGYEGMGRMASPESVLAAIEECMKGRGKSKA
jgi:phosphopantothenoylcysteine decarboxylase/phosphopantothenate--cysteine ligase